MIPERPKFNPANRPAPPLPAKPRRVRGGVKIAAGQGIEPVAQGEGAAQGEAPSTALRPSNWAAQRWGRLVEQAAEGPSLVEGLEYARLGQTRRLTLSKGVVDAAVQGRANRAYVSRIEMQAFNEEQWGKVIDALSEGAIYAAKLLSGEVPSNIEDLFGPLGLRLFPLEPGDVRVSCTCGYMGPQGETPPGGAWCKHVCCVAHLLAARLASDPYVMFALRGLDGEDLKERLRQRRAVAGAAGTMVPVYVQRVPGVAEHSSLPLDQCVENFWDAGEGLEKIEFPIAPPVVSHPLLRRLGPSPFANAAFPLVGLLASCYEVISEEAVEPKVEDDHEDSAHADHPSEPPEGA